jgi:hypothetical protein
MTDHDAYHPRPTDQVVYRPERKKMLTLAVVCGVFFAAGLWLTGSDRSSLAVGGWVMTMLFGGFALVCLLIAAGQRAQLVVGDQGVELVGSGLEPIPWSAVEQIVVTEVRDQRFILLKLRDPELWTSRLGRLRRALVLRDAELTGADLPLPCHGMNAELDEILQTLADRLDAWRRRQQDPDKPREPTP